MKNYARFEELFDELKQEAMQSNTPDKTRIIFATALSRLAEYREDEKNGLLVRFPVAAGTEVFIVDRRGSVPLNLPAKYIAKVQDPSNSAQNLCQLLDGSGLMVLTDKIFTSWEGAQKEALSQRLLSLQKRDAQESLIGNEQMEPNDSSTMHTKGNEIPDIAEETGHEIMKEREGEDHPSTVSKHVPSEPEVRYNSTDALIEGDIAEQDKEDDAVNDESVEQGNFDGKTTVESAAQPQKPKRKRRRKKKKLGQKRSDIAQP